MNLLESLVSSGRIVDIALAVSLRAALTGAGWTWVATWLVAALVFHLADLAQRLNQAKAVDARG